jgi:hypothetical protein
MATDATLQHVRKTQTIYSKLKKKKKKIITFCVPTHCFNGKVYFLLNGAQP